MGTYGARSARAAFRWGVLLAAALAAACGSRPDPGPPGTTEPELPASVTCDRLACADCLRSSLCGFCQGDGLGGRCMEGTSSGPVGACDGTWVYDNPGECTGPEDLACTDTPAELLATDELDRTDAVVGYRVRYLSGGLTVLGMMCVPTSAGPHPIAVVNHGGFGGVMTEADGIASTSCQHLAELGFVTIAAQYRGESDPLGTSEGAIEFCKGEAADIIALTQIARRRCDVDPSRVVVAGGSHGGCTTLQVVQRAGSLFDAAVVHMPPTDMAALYRYCDRARTPGTDPIIGLSCGWLFPLFTQYIGGTPDEVPGEYAVRSPLYFADRLAASGVPFFLVHGIADQLVPFEHSCWLRERLIAEGLTFESYHLTREGAPLTTPIDGCGEATYLPTLPASLRTDERPNIFIAVDGMMHEGPPANVAALLDDFLLGGQATGG